MALSFCTGVNALRYRTMMRSRPAQPVLVHSVCAPVRYIPALCTSSVKMVSPPVSSRIPLPALLRLRDAKRIHHHSPRFGLPVVIRYSSLPHQLEARWAVSRPRLRGVGRAAGEVARTESNPNPNPGPLGACAAPARERQRRQEWERAACTARHGAGTAIGKVDAHLVVWRRRRALPFLWPQTRALQAPSVREFCGYRQRAHLLAEPISSPLVSALVQLHCVVTPRSANANLAELVFPGARPTPSSRPRPMSRSLRVYPPTLVVNAATLASLQIN
ncbi:hypothetical protein B0H13DRAFT_889051 [Mycena leptocephala]|nr:hypothetical protein B0H13DRAFT_889051 [Mycena leptocephala]